MKDKIITAILVIIVGIILLPLAKFNDTQGQEELKGFSARDIQFIESIGFVSNGDGSWTATTTFNGSYSILYTFDYKPLVIYAGVVRSDVLMIKQNTSNQLMIITNAGDVVLSLTTSPITIWGGDVS